MLFKWGYQDRRIFGYSYNDESNKDINNRESNKYISKGQSRRHKKAGPNKPNFKLILCIAMILLSLSGILLIYALNTLGIISNFIIISDIELFKKYAVPGLPIQFDGLIPWGLITSGIVLISIIFKYDYTLSEVVKLYKQYLYFIAVISVLSYAGQFVVLFREVVIFMLNLLNITILLNIWGLILLFLIIIIIIFTFLLIR